MTTNGKMPSSGAPMLVEGRGAVEDPGEQADEHAGHDDQQREGPVVVAQLGRAPGGRWPGRRGAHGRLSVPARSVAVGGIDQVEERRLDVGGAGAARAAPSGVSSASSRPSRISSSRSQRAASSMTWLLTSRVVAAVGEPAEQRPEVAPQHRVEPDGRLVEHQQLGRRRAARPPARRGPPGRRRAGRPRRRRGCSSPTSPTTRSTSRAGRTEHGGEVAQVLAHGQVGVDRRRLGDVADPSRRSGGDPAGRPSTSTSPPATTWTPTTERISVLLPQPLGPSSPVTLPRATSKETSSSTTLPTAHHPQPVQRDRRTASGARLFIM